MDDRRVCEANRVGLVSSCMEKGLMGPDGRRECLSCLDPPFSNPKADSDMCLGTESLVNCSFWEAFADGGGEMGRLVGGI